MKIKAINPTIVAMQLIVPIDGLISIDKNGIADVSPKCATMLVKGTSDWAFVSGKSTAEKDAEVEEQSQEPQVEDEVVDDASETETTEEKVEENERKEIEKMFVGMSLEEMKKYAAEAGIAESEYASINTKKLMRAFLLQKYDEASK